MTINYLLNVNHNLLRFTSILRCSKRCKRSSIDKDHIVRSMSSVKCLPDNDRSLFTKLKTHDELYSTRLCSSVAAAKSPLLGPFIDPTYSYMFGKSDQHLTFKNIDQLLHEVVTNHPDKLVFANSIEGIERTYRQFNEDVNKIVKAMITMLNIEKGDYVGIYSYNCYNWLVLQFACNKLGAILTPINPSYKVDELHYILKEGQIRVLFLPGPKSCQIELNNHLDVLYDQQIQQNQDSLKLQHVVLMDDYDYEINHESGLLFSSSKHHANNVNNLNQYNTRHRINHKLKKVNIMSWNNFIDNDGNLYQDQISSDNKNPQRQCLFDPDAVTPNDLFGVYYTSGTTGRPKGACISQFTAINNAIGCWNRISESKSLTNDQQHVVSCLPLPLFHILAGILMSLTTIVNSNGVTLIITGHKYNVKRMAEDILRYNCISMTCTPTMLIDLLSFVEQSGKELPLKILQVGGAPLMSEVCKRAYKLLPKLEDLLLGYGSTENGGLATMQSVLEPMETKPFTVGPPIDFTEVLIVDSKTGRPVEHGKDGEILTRGYNTMTEYLNDPIKTSEVITPSGWYRTGDIGCLLRHGSLQIVGRSKELIIKGGENIYPKEVEQLLLKHEALEDVHVFGVPSKRYGEEVCAWIKLKSNYSEAPTTKRDVAAKQLTVSKEELLDFCREQITYFKVPKYILFVESFPMTPTKKAQHHIMREQSIEILGLESELK